MRMVLAFTCALAIAGFTPSGPAGALAPQPNGPILITSSGDFPVRELWDPTTGAHRAFPPDVGFSVESFAPDGASVAYMSSYNQTSAEISIRGADGSDHVAGSVLGNEVEQVSFSGDGTRLAVATSDYSTGEGVDRISIIAEDGSAAPRVLLDDAGDPTLISGASWNPQADEIAFIRNGIVGVISSAGGTVHSFAETACGWVGEFPDPDNPDCGSQDPASSVAFSAAGDRVVGQYTHYDGDGNATPYIGIQRRGVATPQHVVDTRTFDGGFPLEESAFSPDGSQVVYTDRYDDDNDLSNVYVISAAGGAATLVAGGREPRWQPCPGGVCAPWSTQIGTTIRVEAPSPRAFGADVPLTITVEAADGSSPPGMVTVSEGGQQVATGELTNGRVKLTAPAPGTLGEHVYTVSYAGTPEYSPASTTVTVLVKVASTLAGHISSVMWHKGAVVWITGSLTTSPQADATGPMRLLDKGTAIKSFQVAVDDHNKVIVKVPGLPKGTHRLKLSYGGSDTVMPSATGTITVRVI